MTDPLFKKPVGLLDLPSIPSHQAFGKEIGIEKVGVEISDHIDAFLEKVPVFLGQFSLTQKPFPEGGGNPPEIENQKEPPCNRKPKPD